jgi:hypothetical protein
MKKSKQFRSNTPYLGDFSTLRASLLVEATSTLVRWTANYQRQFMFTLEQLISRFPMLQCSQPRDTIYAFLSIASDTTAQSIVSEDAELRRVREALLNVPRVSRTITHWARRMIAAETYAIDYSLPVEAVFADFVLFAIRKAMRTSPNRSLDIICRPWAPPIHWHAEKSASDFKGRQLFNPSQGAPVAEALSRPLPSWIPTSDRAPFASAELPGDRRQNADSLTGFPSSTSSNYNASGTRIPNLSNTRLKVRRECLALSVGGFTFGTLSSLAERSMLGVIPSSWAELAGMQQQQHNTDSVPEELWRTLVADRASLGQAPPAYYARTCQAVFNSAIRERDIDTARLIENTSSTVFVEFLLRVQAVIWNRRLMRTQNGCHLGLVPEDARRGDMICILYGCSVPVLLRKKTISEEELHNIYKRDLEQATILIQRNWRARMRLRRIVGLRPSLDGPTASLPTHHVAKTLPGSWPHSELEPDLHPALQPVLQPILWPEPSLNFSDWLEITSREYARRNSRHYYILIGEYYVHGMMDGQAITWQNENGIKSQIFELR